MRGLTIDLPLVRSDAVPEQAAYRPRARVTALSTSAERDQLQLLRAAVEGGLDGMVVVSSDGTMLTYNERFAEIWPIPPEVVATGSDEAALQSVLDKLADPGAFLLRVRELYDRASGTARDELLLLDGRTLDRWGTALEDEDGAYIGWAWYFRDVTDERAAALDADRMGALVAVAQLLGSARDESDVLRAVTGRGASVLGASGAVLCLPAPGLTGLRLLTSDFFDPDLRAELAVVTPDHGSPAVQVATSGAALFLQDRADAVRHFPLAGDLYARAGAEGSAAVPLLSAGRPYGSLGVVFERAHPWRKSDRDLLDALAALAAQALDRIRAEDAEKAATAQIRSLAETLQRSLLTAPPQGERLSITVRYQPAAEEAQVGGDWYYAFEGADGRMTLVVGDVAGHDRDAAAAMAQVRNVLRGIGQALEAPPGQVLTTLDQALDRLLLSSTATAVLCHTWPAPEPGAFHLHWSNAGHPPPLLLHPDGTAELLSRAPELLLGVDPGSERADHGILLMPGATLVLYTDGLVERKGQDLDEGLERLRCAGAELARLSPDELCDALLDRLAAGAADDVALLVLRLAD